MRAGRSIWILFHLVAKESDTTVSRIVYITRWKRPALTGNILCKVRPWPFLASCKFLAVLTRDWNLLSSVIQIFIHHISQTTFRIKAEILWKKITGFSTHSLCAVPSFYIRLLDLMSSNQQLQTLTLQPAVWGISCLVLLPSPCNDSSLYLSFSNICKATAVTHTKLSDRNLLRKETSFGCYTSSSSS